MNYKPYALAEDLERYLGDPMNPEQTFSFKRVVEFDETEEYPDELFQELYDWGFQHYEVPEKFGGKLTSFEELFAIARTVSRRDVTIMVGMGVTFFGSLPVWLAGTDAQREHVARLLLGEHKFGLGASEQDHGSDLLANDCYAEKVEDGYLLTGEKWTIGNARKGSALTILAKTSDQKGPRSFSLFFVERDKLDPSTFHSTPKIKTLGMRAHDLSGIKFEETFIPEESLIGSEGEGFLLTNRSILMTRTLCSALSLGAADTALRTVLNFAISRKLFGKRHIDIPHIQNSFVESFIDILICDCLSTSTARAWHVLTRQMGLWAPIVKYFAPFTLEKMIQSLTVPFGARSFLREAHDWGVFQKIYRDIPIVNIFEGSEHAQLHFISLQLKHLLTAKPSISQEEMRATLDSVFRLDQEISSFFEPEEIDIHSHGENYALQGLGVAMEKLMELSHTRSDELVMEIKQFIEELQQQIDQLREVVTSRRMTAERSTFNLEMARKYSRLHTAATCIQLWVHNQGKVNPFFDQGQWLYLALNKLLRNVCVGREDTKPSYTQHVLDYMLELHRENKHLAIVPIQLAKGE